MGYLKCYANDYTSSFALSYIYCFDNCGNGCAWQKFDFLFKQSMIFNSLVLNCYSGSIWLVDCVLFLTVCSNKIFIFLTVTEKLSKWWENIATDSEISYYSDWSWCLIRNFVFLCLLIKVKDFCLTNWFLIHFNFSNQLTYLKKMQISNLKFWNHSMTRQKILVLTQSFSYAHFVLVTMEQILPKLMFHNFC
jgi:hypothetical protein